MVGVTNLSLMNGKHRWAFSIWGVIFLFELVFVVWGAFAGNRDSRVVQEGVGCWFAIACVVQVNRNYNKQLVAKLPGYRRNHAAHVNV